MSLFEELKRRNVVRVAIAYTVAAWLLVQVGDIARESFEAPAWVMKMVITALIAGFPIVVFFSWAFEITPDGIKREKDVDRSQSITGETSQKLNTVTIVLLVLAIAVVGIDRYLPEAPAPEKQPVTSTPVAIVTEPAIKSTEATDRNSIAVLPFINLSDDPSQEYFSDGIAEELLNLLVKVDGLNVASRTSSFAFKGSNTSIPEIAKQLKVTNVLEGSVRKAGSRVRITAQLIDTSNDRHLWSETYDRELDDIFAIQDEIANAIVDALTAELGLDLDAGEVSVTADTSNMDAYELFLQGRGQVIDRRNLQEAAKLLERAVELDPEFARAWSVLGMAYHLIPGWEVMTEEQHIFYGGLAEQAVDRALELDPDNSLSVAIKAMRLQFAEGGPDWEKILGLIDRAIQLDPNNATALLWKGLRLSEIGYQAKARECLERCLEIDPAYQNCRRHLSRVAWILGDDEIALQLYADIARSGFTTNDAIFTHIFLYKGNVMAGILAANYLRATYPDFPFDEWLYAIEHPDQDLSAYLPAVLKWLDGTPNKPIGANENLLLTLGAYDRLELDLSYVNNWIWLPDFPRFKQSSHFQRVIRDLNLPPYWEKHGLPPGCEKIGEEYHCD